MNYSFIKLAEKQLTKLEEKCLEWKKRVSLSIFTLTRTDSSEEQKKKVCDSLLEHTNFISEEAGKILDELKVVSFSENQVFLYEEKNRLIQKYEKLIVDLRKIKEIISQQVKRKTTIITPLQRKVAKKDYCYFCDVSIVDDFSYKLKREEQETLGVEISEGAAFCSRKCLWNHCDEHKKREKLRQAEKEKIREKIEKDKEAIAELQEQNSKLAERINRLEIREHELELLPESSQFENSEKVGFFRRLGQKLGLAKKPNPLSKLERTRKLKKELNIQLEESEEKLKRFLITLSLDEQKEKERKRLEEKILLKKVRNSTDKITVNEEEETFED